MNAKILICKLRDDITPYSCATDIPSVTLELQAPAKKPMVI